MAEQKKPEPKALTIKIDEEKGQGTYVNLFLSNFTPAEFVLDAVVLLPGLPMGKLLSRSVMTPATAKRLAMLLTEHVKQYEQRFGTINVPAAPRVETSVH